MRKVCLFAPVVIVVLLGCGEPEQDATASPSVAPEGTDATTSPPSTSTSNVSTETTAAPTSSATPVATAPPTTMPETVTPTTAAIIGDIAGRVWSNATYATDLGIGSGMTFWYQGARQSDGVVLGLHELVDPASIRDMVWGGRHLLLFSDADPNQTPPTQWTVTATLDVALSADEQLSLPHVGCWVDGVYDETVFSVITPPLVDGAVDLFADEWPSRRAWRYARSGAPVEIDPIGVWCELAGEPVSHFASVDVTSIERFIETVVGATFRSVRHIGQPDGTDVLPLPVRYTTAAGLAVDPYGLHEFGPADEGYHGRHVVVVSTFDGDGVQTAVAAIPMELSEEQFSSIGLGGACFVDGLSDKNVWAALYVFDMSAIDGASVVQAWRYDLASQAVTELDPARVTCTTREGSGAD